MKTEQQVFKFRIKEMYRSEFSNKITSVSNFAFDVITSCVSSWQINKPGGDVWNVVVTVTGHNKESSDEAK